MDDAQRGSPGYEDVWNYDDGSSSQFTGLERDFARGTILKNPAFEEYKGYFYGKLQPKPEPEPEPVPSGGDGGESSDNN